jgi:hypothetical protein
MPVARSGFPALHAAIQLYEAGEGVSAGLARVNPACDRLQRYPLDTLIRHGGSRRDNSA